MALFLSMHTLRVQLGACSGYQIQLRTRPSRYQPWLATLWLLLSDSTPVYASLVFCCQAPAEVVLEPKELSAGTTCSLSAGGAIPETTARVTNGLGQFLVKALLGGQRAPLTLIQRLWRLKDGQGELYYAQTHDPIERLLTAEIHAIQACLDVV